MTISQKISILVVLIIGLAVCEQIYAADNLEMSVQENAQIDNKVPLIGIGSPQDTQKKQKKKPAHYSIHIPDKHQICQEDADCASIKPSCGARSSCGCDREGVNKKYLRQYINELNEKCGDILVRCHAFCGRSLAQCVDRRCSVTLIYDHKQTGPRNKR